MNTIKYKKLAANSPDGQRLHSRIVDRYDEWIKIVIETNLWRTYKMKLGDMTPKKCADIIFYDALWGYGLMCWDPYGPEAIKSNKVRRVLAHVNRSIPLDFYYLDQWLENIISS